MIAGLYQLLGVTVFKGESRNYWEDDKWHTYLLIIWSRLFIFCTCLFSGKTYSDSWCSVNNCVRESLVLDTCVPLARFNTRFFISHSSAASLSLRPKRCKKKLHNTTLTYSKFHLFSLASNFPLQCMWGTNWHHHHAAQETQQERQKESVQLTSWRGNTPDSFYSTWTDMPLLSLTLLSQYILNFNILSPPSGETIRLHQSCSPIRILWNLRNTSSVLATS